MPLPNPKNLSDLDLVDLIYQKEPARYERLVSGDRIVASRKRIVSTFKEVYDV